MSKKLENKKIIIFLCSLELGGAERQAILLANHLRNHEKADVHVWAFSTTGTAVDQLKECNIPFEIHNFDIEAKGIRFYLQLLKLIFDVRRFKPDIIMPYTYWPNIICGRIWKYTGAKACVWNQRDGGFGFKGNKFEEKALRNCSAVVSNSEEGKQYLTEHYKNISPIVIHNGIVIKKLDLSQEEARKSLKLLHDKFIALMIANLNERKDHDTLIKAWRIVVDKSPKSNPLLLLAGKQAETYPRLKELTKQLNLEENVMFLDFVSDVQSYITASDLSVFSSNVEGSPNGILETMAEGLPVVATDITATREALGDDYDYLAPVNNPTIFAQKVLIFIKNKELRIQIGSHNKQRVEKAFGLDNMCKNYIDLLSQLKA